MKRALACLLTVLPLGPRLAAEKPRTETPRKSGIVETTTTRLAQLDVTVSGPKEEIERLGRDDFEVKVNRKLLTGFLVDRLCGEGEGPGEPSEASTPAEARAASRPISYLLYFDHPHLTMAGRQRAIDLARELVPTLVSGGSRAMIVSNARAVTTVAQFSSDADELLSALKRLEGDREQWDFYPQQEQDRIAQVFHSLNRDGTDRAVAQARTFYLEDRWRGERDARRLAMTLGLLTEVDPPKAVLYFADTTRENPGDFYLQMFSESALVGSTSGGEIAFLRNAAPTAANLLDRVVQEASAHGIRFYPIQAQGLVAPTPLAPSLGGSYSAANQRVPSMLGVEDAQDSLRILATETGGRAFLNGVGADRIASRVLDDLACMYLISFDPAGLPEDGPLPVVVRVKRPGITAQTRGQVVIQSESARRTSKLMAAFLTPDAQKSEVPIRTGVIPTGYERGSFTGLVQVAVAGGEAPGTTWDLGASLVSRERVRQEGSGRISVSLPGAPVVLEREMTFPPGPWELVSVAHEAATGQVASRRDEGTWPDPDAAEAVVGPISVVQHVSGAFLRDGKARTSGSLGQSEQAILRIDQPTAVVGIVCRGKRVRGALRVERSLEGESRADFPSMEIDMGEDRCAVFRDLVPPRTMSEGSFRYSVRVLHDQAELARGERTFHVVAERPPGPSPTPDSD